MVAFRTFDYCVKAENFRSRLLLVYVIYPDQAYEVTAIDAIIFSVSAVRAILYDRNGSKWLRISCMKLVKTVVERWTILLGRGIIDNM